MTTTRELTCPKCNGRMLQGFLPDHTYGALLVGGWYPGQPEKSFWAGTKARGSGGIPVGAFRCEKCGFLELYADPVFAAS